MQDSETSPTEEITTASRILDVAQELIQRYGYSDVSYGDLATELDLTTAAIHYHFPSKADLGRELVRRYREVSAERLSAIRERTDSLYERLTQYSSLYTDIFDRGGGCLCGVLAADASTLPEEVREETERFFEQQEEWLTEIIAAETTAPPLEGYDTPRQGAELILATIEGAMITKRTRDTGAYEVVLRRLIDAVAA